MKKRWLAILLVVCLVTAMMSTVAFAAVALDQTLDVGLTLKTTDCSDSTWTYDAANKTITGSVGYALIGSITDTLTITNVSGGPLAVSFTVSVLNRANEITITTPSGTFTNVSAGHQVSEQLEDTKSITIKLGEGAFRNPTTITITNFNAAPLGAKKNLTLAPVDKGGSYQVQIGSGDVQTVSTSTVKTEFSPADTIRITPVPAEDYIFYRCKIGNTYYLQESLVDGVLTAPTLAEDTTISVEFLHNSAVVPYRVGSNLHASWEDAMTDAKSTGNVVIMVENYTLPSELSETGSEKTGTYVKQNGTKLVYEVPSGVTFLIPYSSSNSTNDLTGQGDHDPSGAFDTSVALPEAGFVYRTMTVENGATINVYGNFVVNAYRQCKNANTPQGCTSGGYGKLILGGTMNVYGTLVARGYIVDTNHGAAHNYGTGTGRIYAKSGSTVKVLFQMIDYRGGTCTSEVNGAVLPITNYSIANIMVMTEYQYGSTLMADFHAAMSYQLAYAGITDTISLLTTSDKSALFRMKVASGDVPDAKIIMDYDYTNDRTVVVIAEGTVEMANLSLNIASVEVNSADSQLPVADSLEIYVGDYPGKTTGNQATLNVTNPTKMLPAAKVHVQKNGTLNLRSSLFMYADEDYNASWSDNKLRTRLNIPEVDRQNTRVIPNTDAKIYIYENGTINLSGEFGQSGNSTDAIQIKGENAHLNLNGSNLGVPNAEIYECNGTSSTEVLVDAANGYTWTGVKGLLSGISENSTDYVEFANEQAGIGEYKSVLIDGTYYWYKYAVTFNVTVEGGEKQTITKYLCVDNYTFNPTEELKDGSKYVITATDAGTADTDDPNGSLAVANGWENLVLTGITEDTTVNLTVKPYDYRVSYTDNGEAAPVEYVEGNTFTHTWPTTPVLITPTFTDWAGNKIAVSNDGGKPVDDKTVFTATLTCDTKIAFTTDSEVWQVTWKVTDVNGTQLEDEITYVSKDGNATYTVQNQPDDAWYIIDDDKATVTGTRTGVKNSRTSYTVEGVGSVTTVEIELTKYDHQVTVALIPDDATDSTSIKLNPYYFNGDSTSIKNTDIISDLNRKYTFKEDNAISCDGATVSATKEKLTASNVTAKSIIFTAYVEQYDSVVTINQNSEVKLKNYYKSSETVTYSFAPNIRIDSCQQLAGDSTTPTTFTDYTNPVVNTDGTITNATISFTAGTDDVILNAKTSSFDHIVTVVEYRDTEPTATEKVPEQTITQYISGNEYTTYSCPEFYYVKSATVDGQGTGTPDGIGTEIFKVTGLSKHPTVTIYLQSYDAKVIWYDVATEADLETDYITEITDSNGMATYTCDAKKVAWANTYPSGITFNPDTGETIEVRGIKTGNDVRIGLKLYDYEYKVQFNDGAGGKLVYVNAGGKDVLNSNSDVVYTAGANKYITGYTLNTDAVATVDRNKSVNTNVADGWDSVKVTNIHSDVDVNLTLKPYDYKVTWNVKASVNGDTDNSTHVDYVTKGDDGYATAEHIIDSKYTITDVAPTVGEGSYTSNVATVSKINGNTDVTVLAQDYKYKITLIVDGEELDPEPINEDSFEWTVPARTDEKTYVVVGAEITRGDGTIEHTNKKVTIKPTSDVTVKIKTEEALTNYTALWGDMSYRYYKNGAFYSWDETAYVWKLIDQYTWTHKSGSRIHSYADLDELDKIEQYTVPNGSVMIVNPTNQKITATVTITLDTSSGNWKTTPTITLTAEDEECTTGIGTITVTLDAHSTLLISGTLEGTPADNLTDAVSGSCNVTIDPID